MNTLIALLIGVLFAGAVYCLLRRSITRMVIGLLLLSQTVNLIVFTSTGLSDTTTPVIAPDEKMLSGNHADPLPQALVLTAIVIGFGLIAFTLTLFQRSYVCLGNDDVDTFNTTDK